jgi:GT2 family glycosyltransferase
MRTDASTANADSCGYPLRQGRLRCTVKPGTFIGDAASAIPVLGAHVRRLRALMKRQPVRHGVSHADYSAWVRSFDTPSRRDLGRLGSQAASFRLQPSFSFLLPVFNPDPRALDATIRSVRAQTYTCWQLCIVHDRSSRPAITHLLQRHFRAEPRINLSFRAATGCRSAASNAALTRATGAYVALLDAGDLIPPHALHWVTEAINRNPDAKVVYSDEDKVDARGRRFDPHFKCDFNHVLLMAQDMVSRLCVYGRSLIEDVGALREGLEGAQDHDLALRCIAAISREEIVHVPRILYHRRTIAGVTARDPDTASAHTRAALQVVTEHVRRLDSGATVEPAPESPMHMRIRHSLPSQAPRVSIVICTRDNRALLQTAIQSLVDRTTYPHYEITVLDNGSRDDATLSYLSALSRQPAVTVVRDDSPFNYSRLNNTAAMRSSGDVLCLLNDDIEVLTPGWLEEMVSFALQAKIGAVGARLWYPDGTLQHGGVIIGAGGVAGHAHLRLPRVQPGYFSRAVLQQEVSAVTGACLVIRRSVFEEVGGLDERIAVAFNDVDLCLRIRAAGYRNIWTPFAELVHHESASRGREDTPEQVARFQQEVRFMKERWGAALDSDPCYNPNLSMTSGNFQLVSRKLLKAARRGR